MSAVVHLILKFQNPRINGKVIDTIQEHQSILNNNGFVYFGVLGKGVGEGKARLFEQQMKQGKETNLYLVSSRPCPSIS